MVKSLDGATLGAIADRSRIVVRNFVLFTVKDSAGAGAAIKLDADEDVTYGLHVGEGVEHYWLTSTAMFRVSSAIRLDGTATGVIEQHTRKPNMRRGPILLLTRFQCWPTLHPCRGQLLFRSALPLVHRSALASPRSVLTPPKRELVLIVSHRLL